MRPHDILSHDWVNVGLGAGAGVIMLEPESLHRGATHLRDIAGRLTTITTLGCPMIPNLGPGCGDVAGEVSHIQGMLTRHSQRLAKSASELDKRAFFAEIADSLYAHAPLSAAQLATLMKYLHEEGSLKYAP